MKNKHLLILLFLLFGCDTRDYRDDDDFFLKNSQSLEELAEENDRSEESSINEGNFQIDDDLDGNFLNKRNLTMKSNIDNIQRGVIVPAIKPQLINN